ncbi:MAG: LCP family protein [Patescibacteria group bacterium]
MEKYQPNLIDGLKKLPETSDQEPFKRKNIILSPVKNIIKIIAVVLVIGIFFYTNTIYSGNDLLPNLGKLSFWEGMVRLAIKHDKLLKGELYSRSNILILGMGGVEHEGPYLTDTIILASIKPQEKLLSLISIPRDLYAPVPDYGWQKINAANSLGETRDQNGGKLTSQVVENILDLPVHYWITVNFSAFEDLIDMLGGVEINVERGFTDTQFPGPNYTYRVIGFEKGLQLMSGRRALQFARSRHGNNNEGSDFARARRQQKIISAIYKKIMEQDIASRPQKILQLYNILSDKIKTNLDFSELIRLAKIINDINEEKIINYVYDASPNGILYADTNSAGAYILKTKSGSFKEMAEIAKNIFDQKPSAKIGEKNSESIPSNSSNNQATAIPGVNNLPEIKNNNNENTIDYDNQVVVLNGTAINGLAARTKAKLEAAGLVVPKIGNAPVKAFKNSVVYTKNTSSSSLEKIKQVISNVSVETEIPDYLKNYFPNKVNHLLIIVK